MTREILENQFGRDNVTKITADNGAVSYLTASTDFASYAKSRGAVALNTYENESKHVLFLFDDNAVEVGRYYMGKKLQGKSVDELIEKKSNLCIFESYNPNTKQWVPCVGLSSQPSLAATAKRF
jgi:hypothetical protein